MHFKKTIITDKMTRLTIDDFEQIFDIMEASFPSDEYRTKQGQRALFCDPRYYVFGKKQAGRLVGFIALWQLDSLVFIEHFAVCPDLRGGGIGSALICEVLKDAKKTVCLEVEPPCDDITRRRIGFYKRCGFVFNDFDYTQPAMADGKNPIPLRIMTYKEALLEPQFNNLRDVLYKDIYHVV